MGENGSARRYVVLRADGEGLWRELGVIVATGAHTACRRAAEEMPETVLEAGVELRAVPQRAWDASLTPLKLQRTSRLVAP